jgi:hypothetical protein
MTNGNSPIRPPWLTGLLVFAAVLAADLLLVGCAGTDIPFHDQWDIEGKWLYPAWLEGTLRFTDLLRPCNEHRIVWTHGLNLVLFTINGQWDPLAQMVVIGFMRAACAALLAWRFGQSFGAAGRGFFGLVVVIAFLPHLAWHSVLWGIESHTYFAIGFSWLAFVLLCEDRPSIWRSVFGFGAGVAAAVAMAPGELVAPVLLGLCLLRAIENGRPDWGWLRKVGLLSAMLLVAVSLHTEGARDSEWRPLNFSQFVVAAGRALSWPHVGFPPAAIALNLPLGLIVALRILKRRCPVKGEDFVLLVGGWSAAIALATAWARGGGPELDVGIPSRYVDFLIGLPLANVWAAMILVRESSLNWRTRSRLLFASWAVFVLVGWLGLSFEVMTRLIVPRARDREAPARLVRTYQLIQDPAVFAGQPRLLIPHPALESVRTVLDDPRMRGRLPPSLQPERPMGPLSRFVRFVLRRN